MLSKADETFVIVETLMFHMFSASDSADKELQYENACGW